MNSFDFVFPDGVPNELLSVQFCTVLCTLCSFVQYSVQLYPYTRPNLGVLYSIPYGVPNWGVLYRSLYASQIGVPNWRPKIGIPIRVPNELFIKVLFSGGPGCTFWCTLYRGVVQSVVHTRPNLASRIGGIVQFWCTEWGYIGVPNGGIV